MEPVPLFDVVVVAFFFLFFWVDDLPWAGDAPSRLFASGLVPPVGRSALFVDRVFFGRRLGSSVVSGDGTPPLRSVVSADADGRLGSVLVGATAVVEASEAPRFFFFGRAAVSLGALDAGGSSAARARFFFFRGVESGDAPPSPAPSSTFGFRVRSLWR